MYGYNSQTLTPVNKKHIDALALVDRWKRPVVQQLQEIGMAVDSIYSYENYSVERDQTMRAQEIEFGESYGYFSYENWLLNKFNCRVLTPSEVFKLRHKVSEIPKVVRLLLREKELNRTVHAWRIRNYDDDKMLTGLQFNILVDLVVKDSIRENG